MIDHEASACAHIAAADVVDEMLTYLGDPALNEQTIANLEASVHDVILPAFNGLGHVVGQLDDLDNRLSAVEATR